MRVLGYYSEEPNTGEPIFFLKVSGMAAQGWTPAFIIFLLIVCSCQKSAQQNTVAPVSMGHSTHSQMVDIGERGKPREKTCNQVTC